MQRNHDSIGRADMCIITFYDEPFRKFGDLAWTSIREYGELHNIDPIRFQTRSTNRPSSWEKIPCIQKAFDLGYEFVFWVDADAVIVDLMPDIRSALRDAERLAGAGDFFLVRHAVQGGICPNMGIFVVRNSSRSRQVLSDLWNMEEFVFHRWWEQAAFLSYFGLIDDLPQSERGLFGDSRQDVSMGDQSCIRWLDIRWNCIPHLIYTQGDIPESPIIVHYAGRRWFQRLDGMTVVAFKNGYLRFGDDRFLYYAVMYCAAKIRILASSLYVALVRRIKRKGADRQN